jgi:hypothetical protein
MNRIQIHTSNYGWKMPDLHQGFFYNLQFSCLIDRELHKQKLQLHYVFHPTYFNDNYIL